MKLITEQDVIDNANPGEVESDLALYRLLDELTFAPAFSGEELVQVIHALEDSHTMSNILGDVEHGAFIRNLHKRLVDLIDRRVNAIDPSLRYLPQVPA